MPRCDYLGICRQHSFKISGLLGDIVEARKIEDGEDKGDVGNLQTPSPLPATKSCGACSPPGPVRREQFPRRQPG